MFTGLVEVRATVVDLRAEPPGKRLSVEAPRLAPDTAIGDSIAVSGCCLTVVATTPRTLSFQAGPETLLRTNLGQLRVSDPVNLERSLCVGDRLGGHFVTGHVDAVGTVEERRDDGAWSTIWFRVPAELTRHIAPKGSIAIDGVSLTVVDVEGERFSVQLIPHTLAVTTLGHRKPGDQVNVETDLLAKYVERQRGGAGLACPDSVAP